MASMSSEGNVGGELPQPVKLVEIREGAFNYDDPIALEVSQVSGHTEVFMPTNSTTSGPWRIDVPARCGTSYVNGNRIGCEVKLKIVRGNGDVCRGLEDIVAPVNMLGAMLWNMVELHINNKNFMPGTGTMCGISAYMDNILTYTRDAAETHLMPCLYYPDSPNNFDNMKITEDMFRTLYADCIVDGTLAKPHFPRAAEALPALPEPDVEFEVGGARKASIEQMTEARINGTVVDDREKRVLRRVMAYQQDVKNKLAEARTRGHVVEEGGDVNLGFVNRFNLTRGSDELQLYSTLQHDFLAVDNYIGPDHSLRFTLHKNRDEFLLNSVTGVLHDYKIQITSLKLHVPYVTRAPGIPKALVENYRMNESHMFFQNISQNTLQANLTLVDGGTLPKTVVICFVSQNAMLGDYQFSPTHFHHYFIDNMRLEINGRYLPNADGLQLDFARKGGTAHMALAYNWLFENSGALDAERGNLIHWNAFQGGQFIVPYDLTPDKCNSLHNHNTEMGQLKLRLHFAKRLPESINVVYKMIYPKTVQINASSDNMFIRTVGRDPQVVVT